MKVYHGSYMAIENIDFSFCRKKRDFGKGFYVTKIREQAEYWANRKGEDNDTEGVVTEFEFDECFFEDEFLKVLRFEGYSTEWLDFVTRNRINKSKQQTHDYDIIEGPVADDDIATRVYDYINRKISKKQFLKELERKTPTHQICFCTMQSLQALGLSKYYIDRKIMDIDKEILKALMIDYGLSESEAADKHYSSNTYTQLADEASELYLKPWQEIYEMLKIEINNKIR
ncbi:MAG: DUF3990 domain-containing protein [Lentimicrobiaceae bacterium]|nr:DUF3990 domain-containing protein [Lentimicrobiaceae bacterium]